MLTLLPNRRHFKTGRKLQWDPQAERFPNDEAANALLQPRPIRGEWKLPEV